MIIRCTKDLRMKINPTITETPDTAHPVFSWHAKKMEMHGKNVILLVNDSNRYVVVLYGLTDENIEKLHEHLPAAIRELLQAEAIRPDVVEAYLDKAGPVVYGTTGSRQNIARLNRAGRELEYYTEDMREDSVVQTGISLTLSDSLVGDGKDDYFTPNEIMRRDLMDVLGFESVGFPALQLKAVVRHGDQEIWRRIVIPEKLLQRHLGAVLNIVFGRQYFSSYDLEWTQAKEWGVLESATAEDIPRYGLGAAPVDPESMKETWTYHVETEKTIHDEFYNCPKCLDGEGGFPPEERPARSKQSNQMRALRFADINMRLEKIRS